MATSKKASAKKAAVKTSAASKKVRAKRVLVKGSAAKKAAATSNTPYRPKQPGRTKKAAKKSA